MNTDRIYQSEDQHWYFNVRGNAAKGPFETYHEAERALADHLRRCRHPLAESHWPRVLKALTGNRRPYTEARHP